MGEELMHPDDWDESVVRDLVYSALYAGVKSVKGMVEFDEEDVGDWIEVMKDDEMSKVFQALIDSKGEVEKGDKKKVKA